MTDPQNPPPEPTYAVCHCGKMKRNRSSGEWYQLKSTSWHHMGGLTAETLPDFEYARKRRTSRAYLDAHPEIEAESRYRREQTRLLVQMWADIALNHPDPLRRKVRVAPNDYTAFYLRKE